MHPELRKALEDMRQRWWQKSHRNETFIRDAGIMQQCAMELGQLLDAPAATWCEPADQPAPTETASSDLYVPFVRGDRPESIRLSTILDAIKGHPKLLAATRAALTETNPHTGSRLSSAVTRVELRCDGPACRGRLIVLQPETAPTETKCTCKGHASFCALAFQVGDTVRLKLLPDGPSGVVEYVQSGYTNGIGVRWPNGNRYPYEPEELEGRPEHVSNEESGETDKNT